MSIIKKFGDTKIEFKEIDDDIWVKIADIGRALKYDRPSSGANKLFNNHEDELLEFSTYLQIEGKQTRHLNEQGVYLFCMLSGAKKAKEFRKWVAKVLQKLRKRVDLTPAEYLLAQAERFVELEKQGEVLTLVQEKHTEQIAYLQTVLLPEAKITEKQAENIREAISTIAYRYNDNSPPFGMVWGRTKNQYGFAAYREIPREEYPSVMAFLDSWLRRIKK